MTDENPYESPANEQAATGSSVDRDQVPEVPLSRVVPIYASSSLLASFAMLWLLRSVPYAMLLLLVVAPALLRALRIRAIDRYRGTPHHIDRVVLHVVLSLMMVLPAALGAFVAFCCVCGAGSFIGWAIESVLFPGTTNYGFLVIGGGLLLAFSIFLALLTGDYITRRNGYFLRDKPEKTGT